MIGSPGVKAAQLNGGAGIGPGTRGFMNSNITGALFAHRRAARHGVCKVALGTERRRDGGGVRFLRPELPIDLVDQE